MLSPEENQMAICLLKYNLEEIKDELVKQSATFPEFDAENEQKYRDTLNILHVVRSLGEDSEKLHQENVRLVAKRLQLKRQSDELKKALENSRKIQDEIENEIALGDKDMEEAIRKYEDCLREKAVRFRETKGYYDEAQINSETAKLEAVISNMESEMNDIKNSVSVLKKYHDELEPIVPDDLLTIVGKSDLEEQVKTLNKECEGLQLKLNELLSNFPRIN